GARRVLRAASFFGRDFTAEGVAALATGAESQRVEPWLAWLALRELIARRDARAYSFRHGIVCDAAYAMVTDEDRRIGHLLAARFLEAQGERDAALLAEHYERGGAPSDAARNWTLAAAQALETSDLAAAIERANRATARGASGAPHVLLA